MSTILDKKTKINSKQNAFHIERYDSAMEVVEKCKMRTITDSAFHNMKTHSIEEDWHGVKSYDEALELLQNGYQPTVDAMKGVFKAGLSGEGKRFSFQNSVVGYAPVVPLALKGVPNSMLNMTMRPIKAKVIDVYYDITCSAGTKCQDIIDAGRQLLGIIIELERQGYRFNLYAVQSYCGGNSADMLVVKMKSATQPLDLKRISFPLTHTAFFRVIGFDWYSKVPGGKYRGGYGMALGYEYDSKEMRELGKQLFGNTAVMFSAKEIIHKDKAYIKEVVQNGNSKD